MEVERELAFLDERYLGDGPRLRDEAERARALQAARDDEADATSDSHSADGAATIGKPNPLVRQDPLVCDYERVEMDTTPDNALVGMAYVIGDAADRNPTRSCAKTPSSAITSASRWTPRRTTRWWAWPT